MNVSTRPIPNSVPKAHQFSVKFHSDDEPFYIELNNTLTTLRSLKRRIEVMYHYKYARQIKIDKLAYSESYIDLASDHVGGYNDAPRKYDWHELKNDEDVEEMFNCIEIDPKFPR
ncbi:hypothetical protein L195_g046416, partial [Trifolium pratense]